MDVKTWVAKTSSELTSSVQLGLQANHPSSTPSSSSAAMDKDGEVAAVAVAKEREVERRTRNNSCSKLRSRSNNLHLDHLPSNGLPHLCLKPAPLNM